MENENKPEIEVETVEDTIEVQSIEDDIKEVLDDTEQDTVPEVETKKETEVEPTERKPRAKQRIRKLTEENKRLKEELAAKSESTSDESGSTNEPDIDNFETYDEYVEAVEAFEKKLDEPKSNTDTQVQDEVIERLEPLLDDAKDKYADFDEVVQNPDLTITLGFMKVLADNFEEAAGEMLYNLAQDKNTLSELSSLSEKDLLKKLVLIENDISNGVIKQAKRVKGSKAPEPISPVGGKGHKPQSLDDEDLSYEEHEALLNKQSTTARGGFL